MPPDFFPQAHFVYHTFCPSGLFVLLDVLSLGRLAPVRYVSGRYVSGRYVSRNYVSGRFVSAAIPKGCMR